LILLHERKPPLAHIFSQEFEELDPVGYTDFEIRETEEEGEKEVFILPDIATCDECLGELFNKSDRRYLYPFINCTNCGPRFTIIERLPYDRPNTTMKVFEMCPSCREEYEDPANRRFHAQPNACPRCGPWVSLYSPDGNLLAERGEALRRTVEEIRRGGIVAVKGVGGFHLVCDARNEGSVRRLRERKRRQEKPFAVMFRDIVQLEEFAQPTDLEKALLLSPERPIVLVRKREELAPSVAPDLKRIGAFLPYSPLHHIILRELGFPVVATSGNLSDEPIVIDNDEALEKLFEFADLVLLHNRDIKRRCDDSVLKVVGGVPTPIRRSRGYAPMPIELPVKLSKRTLAVGGMLKNTFALGRDNTAFLSQHIGDVESLTDLEAFEEAVCDLMELYDFEPEVVVCDMHPRYETSRWAEEFSRKREIPLKRIQHHYAHILSCMAENNLRERVLGIAWDGTGYGEDGTLWGGEFLEAGLEGYRRLAHLKPFRLLGGELAVKEPRRVALSLLFHIFGEDAFGVAEERKLGFSERELQNLYIAWRKGINSPLSSSVGRLFDGIASLLGLRQVLSYEGQAAMLVEDLYDPAVKYSYPFKLEEGILEWEPLIEAILKEDNPAVASSRFINTLAEISLAVAEEFGIEKVCLSGGVFQNHPLTAKVRELLEGKGFKVYTHRKVPPNDGGIALGQLLCILIR
jgi:hydrogenase maturation protein HypF